MRTLRAPAALILSLALLFGACRGEGADRANGPVNDRNDGTEQIEPTLEDEWDNFVITATHSSLAPKKFRLWAAMKTVRQLAGGQGIGIRERATDNERRAARLIARKFTKLGYNVRIQKYSVDGGRSRNVIARWPGEIGHPLVIGGHMDTAAGSPGANDNASGVATIIEAARLVAGTERAKYIRWVAFGSEEKGDDQRNHVGSEVYVRRMGREGRQRAPGMISVDMIADGKPLLTGSFGIGPKVLGRMVYRRITRNSEISMDYHQLCDCTDNGPFEHAGIPGAYMYSGREPDYHSPTDKPPNLVPEHLKRTGKALMVFVRKLDRTTLRYLRRY